MQCACGAEITGSRKTVCRRCYMREYMKAYNSRRRIKARKIGRADGSDIETKLDDARGAYENAASAESRIYWAAKVKELTEALSVR